MKVESPNDNHEPEPVSVRHREQSRKPGAPTLVDSAVGPIVFGPGLDDINEYDDPC